MKHQYRIITDGERGYKIQFKRWYWFCWEDPSQASRGIWNNSFGSIEIAEEAIEKLIRIHNPTVVKTFN